MNRRVSGERTKAGGGDRSRLNPSLLVSGRGTTGEKDDGDVGLAESTLPSSEMSLSPSPQAR